jgi:hypothetical protein
LAPIHPPLWSLSPVLQEDIVMMIYDGHPSLGMCLVSNPSLETLVHYGWGAGTQECKDTNFPISLYINICRNIDMYITYMQKAKKDGG